MAVTADDLVGTYIGRGQEHIDKDGKVTRPRGREVAYPSRIVYTKEGLVIVVSTPANRAKVNARDFGEASVEEKARVAEGVVAYAGRLRRRCRCLRMGAAKISDSGASRDFCRAL